MPTLSPGTSTPQAPAVIPAPSDATAPLRAHPQRRGTPPDRLTLDHIDAAAITGFLDWLETERHNSISTRNQRLAGLS